MSPDILIDELEGLIESPACGNDEQLLVEHQRGSRTVSTMARASAAVSGMAANGISTARLDIK
jgi:hypothetical protein